VNMAWLGKVTLSDFAGAVTKLSESVKNIEKNFDSALGFDDVSEGKEEGWIEEGGKTEMGVLGFGSLEERVLDLSLVDPFIFLLRRGPWDLELECTWLQNMLPPYVVMCSIM
jgi:hypothetical protein